jgi:sodium transport system ATP-binding protein
VIEVIHLKKKYPVYKKSFQRRQKIPSSSHPQKKEKDGFAVNDLTFHCEKGNVLGLLGLNGAGKTTTLRMLSTALQPSSGNILMNGKSIIDNPQAMRKKIGFLSGTTCLYHRLTVRENVEYFAHLHGLKGKALKSACHRLFSLLDIHDFADKKADSLSTGMKQRANIARSIIHNPEIIVLDEPTTGLDVLSAKTILDFIHSYKEAHIPIIFSTHHLHEVEALCDQVVFIHQGRTQFFGSIDAFKSLDPQKNLYNVFVHLVSQKGTL